MGKAKQNDVKTYDLTEQEWNYIKILSTCLVYHILKDKIISGFLYHVAQARFGYKPDTNLQFEIDLDKEERQIKITQLPVEV